MYLIIRCPNCSTFTYVDQYQEWKLCAVCGEAIKKGRAQVYLDLHNHRDAEAVVHELERYLHKTGKKDLNEEEKESLQTAYAQWMRTNSL